MALNVVLKTQYNVTSLKNKQANPSTLCIKNTNTTLSIRKYHVYIKETKKDSK